MQLRFLATFAAAALLFFIPSCATRPVFDLKTGSNLTPGSTTTAQARQILGPPDYTSQVKDSHGDTLLWNYNYARVLNNGTVTMNRLSLTFQKDVLQQYCYQWNSGPPLRRSTQIAAALESLKKGTSTKADAIAALGEPTGKTGCRLEEKKSSELWFWEQPQNGQRIYRAVNITFNPAGIISEIAQVESGKN